MNGLSGLDERILARLFDLGNDHVVDIGVLKMIFQYLGMLELW